MVDKKKSIWKILWEGLQTLGAGAGILAFKHVLEELLTDAGKKVGKKVGERVGEAFGLSSEGAEKTDDDEISFERVYKELTAPQKKELMEWLGRLRDSDSKLACEFTRRIHNTLIRFRVKHSSAKNKSKSKNKTDDQNENATKEEESDRSYDYKDAIEVAKIIILDILAATTDADRLKILKDRNIKVKEKKPAPAADATKKFFRDKSKKAIDGEKANRKDFNEATASWAERAKAWRESR